MKLDEGQRTNDTKVQSLVGPNATGAAGLIERFVTDDDKPLAMAEPVGWFSLRTLYATATLAAITSLFGERSGRRELLAVLDVAGGGRRSSRQHPDGYFDHSDAPTSDGAFWFDFVADVGDGFDATYSISWLLGRDYVYLAEPGEQVAQPIPRDDRSEETRDAVADARHVLPAGQVLVMGGDEVYPYATAAYYAERTRGPYWAARPWGSANLDANPTDGERSLYAIPGNHDWYDGLMSFAENFCQPGRWFGCWRTQQRRSYFAIKLPHGFWLWGLDTWLNGTIDLPQRNYFEHMATCLAPNDQVILCLPDPIWQTCASPRPGSTTSRRDQSDGASKLAHLMALAGGNGESRVAILLTGDSHYYARHAGSAAETEPTNGSGRQFVICGGGGAFMLGTTTTPEHLAFSDGTTAQLAHAFPNSEQSAAIRKGVFKIAWVHKPFCTTIGLVMLWLLWLVHATTHSQLSRTAEAAALSRTYDGFRHAWVSRSADLLSGLNAATLLSSPGLIVAMAGVIALFVGYAFAGAKHSDRRWLAVPLGIAHFATQLLVAAGVSAGALAIVFDGAGNSLLVGMLVALPLLAVICVAHGLTFAAYLWSANRLAGFHELELYSAQSIEDWKCFLRLKISEHGLTVYPIGLRRISRRWLRAGRGSTPGAGLRSRLYRATGAAHIFGSSEIPVRAPVGTTHIFAPEERLSPELIEDPFTIPARR